MTLAGQVVPGADLAGLWPAPDCGRGAAGTMMNGPGAGLYRRNLSEVCFICAKPSLGTGKTG
jgi:hypothetical protein